MSDHDSTERAARTPEAASPAAVDPITDRGAAGVPAWGAVLDATRIGQTRLASVLGSAMDAIVGIGADRRVFYVNAAAERLFGVAAEDIVGTGIEHLVAPSSRGDLDAALRELDEHASRRHGTRCLLHAVRRNGDVFPVEVSIARSGSGDTATVTLVVRDRGDQDQAQRHAIQSQKLEGIGRLAGGVAHDFNNLLTVILGYCELLRLRQRGGLELDEIANAARRASQLTRQLLAFSRRQVLQVETLDLNALIRGLNRILRRTIGDDILLDVNFADEPLWVVADVGQMEQVLLNLVINARDAMPEGGTLRIATRVAQRTPATDAGPLPSVELIVADSGIGMTDDVRAHIFEPFFTTKGDAGTGLGLAMVYGIVTQTGGHIACESVVGQGATFHVWLPLAAAPPHEGRPGPAMPPSALQGRETVLVLEDDMLVRELAVRALREYGYTALEAQDVDAARRHLDHPGLALVLADVITRGGSLDELTADIARRRPGLPILLMTGYSEALSQRAVDPSRLLRKPFTPTDLLTRIRALLAEAARQG